MIAYRRRLGKNNALMLRSKVTLLLLVTLLIAALFPSTSRAQTLEPDTVHAVLFTSQICIFCRQIVDDQLPPSIEKFGERVRILIVDTDTIEGKNLYLAALEAFSVPRGLPVLFMDEITLSGIYIVPQLPALIETYLAQGGLGWPSIPGLEEYVSAQAAGGSVIAAATQATTAQTSPATPDTAVVSAVLFWMDGCQHCNDVLQGTLPALQEQYGAHLDIRLVEVVTLEDVEQLYELGAAYGKARDQVGVPFLVIGDQVLIGYDQIQAELSTLVESYLASGGVGQPDISRRVDADSAEAAQLQKRPDGFWLAMGVMVFMTLAVLYSLTALLGKRVPSLHVKFENIAFPMLALIGLIVAGYLAYVETQAVEAMCGPVGDCNAVQSSPYARVLGVIPVGVLGMIGYLLILAAWTGKHLSNRRLATAAPLAVFSMSLLGTLFSLYLTYVELFVIQAVCMWCVTSAVVMTLLLLLSLKPAQLSMQAVRK